MSDESDRATAEQLVAEGITWEEVWAAAQDLALERGEWAGRSSRTTSGGSTG